MNTNRIKVLAALSGGHFYAWLSASIVIAGIILLAVMSGNVFAAKGGIPGPPSGGETSNNLSVPGLLTETPPGDSIDHRWFTPTEPELGVHYSYGCDQGEDNGSFSYPNTSCVDNLDAPIDYYTAAECVAADAPCENFEVSRIYWQKVDVNDWWADDDGIYDDPGYVAYVDWGDALEAVSWNEGSVIRVETQPYSSTINGFLPWGDTCETAAIADSLDPEIACKVGLQMWHVSGQGITEHWGVRADEYNVSYNYDSPFQIIKTTNARLNLTKMEPLDALCALPGGNPGDDPPEVGAWDPINAEWAGTCTYSDAPYSVETSVGGKYVYGFNWRMRNVELDTFCPGWVKTGFWRLTFYAPDDVMFNDADAPNVAPPAVPSEVRVLPRTVFNTVLADPPPEPALEADAVLLINDIPVIESDDPTADDRLYRPVIDTANNLTYLDICIVGKTQGGGGGGGGGGDKGGGKP